jgi:5,10-methylenetetrahydromethanopterin reductase
MTVGVICHLPNPSFAEVRELAEAAEAAGADWLGLPDAFWWRDTWLLLAEAALSTSRIGLGPLVTNPYLRHPFHTLAALASLQEIAGHRVFLGLGAGGSELSGAAGISRSDAPQRVEGLVTLLRRVERGEPLDPQSGRTLELQLEHAEVLIAGRGTRILQTAGKCADSALLWAIPQSDLVRSANLVKEPGRPIEIIWAPLVDHGGKSRQRVRTIAAYSVLNSQRALHANWGLTPQTVDQLRTLLVGGGAAAAQDLVPPAALEDLVIADPSPESVGVMARAIGATSIAVPAFEIAEVGQRVGWARDVLDS